MRFDEWLAAERGRASRVCEHFGKSTSAVSQWRINGVPMEHIVEMYEFTEGEVTLEEMLPPIREQARQSA